MRSGKRKVCLAFGIVLMTGLATLTAPARAHHSFAAYDMTRVESAKGAIKEFHWSAPHCAIVVTIEQPDGATKDLLLVSGAPEMFARQRFEPRSFRPGDKVEVSWHPNRNGSDGGSLATLTLPDGRVFHDSAPQLPAPPLASEAPPPGVQPPSPRGQ